MEKYKLFPRLSPTLPALSILGRYARMGGGEGHRKAPWLNWWQGSTEMRTRATHLWRALHDFENGSKISFDKSEKKGTRTLSSLGRITTKNGTEQTRLRYQGKKRVARARTTDRRDTDPRCTDANHYASGNLLSKLC